MVEETTRASTGLRGNSTIAGQARNQPPRVVGFADLVRFHLATGISLRWIATAAAAGPSSIVIWMGVWLCFYVPLVLSVVELSSRHPQEVGLYVWSKRAFGDFSGFMSGWTYWTSNRPYFPAMLCFVGSNLLFAGGGRWARTARTTTYGFDSYTRRYYSDECRWPRHR